MSKLYLGCITGLMILLSSCSSSGPEHYAEELCQCMQESGSVEAMESLWLNTGRFGSQRSEMREANQKMQACSAPILKEMKTQLKDMSIEERKTFLKSFFKASIDTECSDELMDNIPWGFVMTGLSKMVNGMDDSRVRSEAQESDIDF